VRRPSFLSHFGEEFPSNTRPKREGILDSFANSVSRVEAAYFHVVQMHSFPLRPPEKGLHTGHYGILYRAALLTRGWLPGILMRRPFQSPLLPNFNHPHPVLFVFSYSFLRQSACAELPPDLLRSHCAECRPKSATFFASRFVGLPLPTSRYVPLRVHLHREWINPGLPCYINST
jgi:hypothetical protein